MSSFNSIQADLGEEPKLSYERMLNDLPYIVRADFITSSCLHSKLFAIGTSSGRIHILDHQGNKVDQQELSVHLKAVRSISIDEKGEYFASCGDDRVAVYGLCNSEHNFVVIPDKPIKCVAIDPYFHRSGKGRRFVIGDDRLILYERSFLKRYRTVPLQMEEDPVLNVSWHGQFIAWATNNIVKIFDIEQRSLITKIKRDQSADQVNRGTSVCKFCWKDSRTLLIGWEFSVKICLIKDRSHELLYETQLRELPKKYVEIVSMFDTESRIYGLAPFEQNIFTLSIHDPELSIDNETDESKEKSIIKPEINVLEAFPDHCNELSKDTLTPKGCSSDPKWNQYYSLSCMTSESLYFIICPKDVIMAKSRDYDDHVEWLLENSLLKEAYLYAKENSRRLSRSNYKDIEDSYMKMLNDNIEPMMKVNCDETAQLLVENSDSIPMKDVVERLEKNPQYLLAYLHRMMQKDPESCIDYHDTMLNLYSKYRKDLLLSFLKISTNYNLEDALKICQEDNLTKEVVYLYGRMGNLRVALKCLIESQSDIYEAIEFCKEHRDPDLWQDLIMYSMYKPEYISALLKNIGTHINDPIELIDRIPSECEIDGLMPALVKILQDYQLQISLEQSCRDLIASDCFALLQKQMKCQTRGIMISDKQLCDHCNEPLLTSSNMQSNQAISVSAALPSQQQQLNQDDNAMTNIVVFGCHHAFHEDCGANSSPTNIGSSSLPKTLICRICVLEAAT